MFYPYRTTVDKLVDAQKKIAEGGDTVVSAHHVAGRDWVVLAREGQGSAPAECWAASLYQPEGWEPVGPGRCVIRDGKAAND